MRWATKATTVRARGEDRYGRSLAVYDPDREYRYLLTREWDPARPVWAVCMLNPSTADERVLDPTVTRVVRRAQADGAGAVWVLNLFALRSTDPRALYRHADPIGARNDAAIAWAARHADRFVVAWGTHGDLAGRDLHVLELLGSQPIERLGEPTKGGHPRHPLYLAGDTPIVPHP